MSEIARAIRNASTLLMEKSISEAPASTGMLRKSIKRDLYPLKAAIYPTVKYGIYVHEGTRPHWPPLGEIKPGGSIYRWAVKKGIPPFLVARAIARHGTKAQPWMKQVTDKYKDEVNAIFEEALQRIAEKLGD